MSRKFQYKLNIKYLVKVSSIGCSFLNCNRIKKSILGTYQTTMLHGKYSGFRNIFFIYPDKYLPNEKVLILTPCKVPTRLNVPLESTLKFED